MALRLNGDRVETISTKEIETLWRDLLKAAEAVNAVEDCTEKLAAGMEVFGRNAQNIAPLALEIEDAARPR